MQIPRQQHRQFLEDELKAETEDFKRKFLSPALPMLKSTGEMFVGQFVSIRNGEVIVKFSNNRSLPRKGEFLLCMLLPQMLRNYRNWGERTYRDLYKERYNDTDSVCIWHSKCDDRNYSLVGFSKMSLDFVQQIAEVGNVILVFAPQRPPIDYMLHLQKLVSDTATPSLTSILDANYVKEDKTLSLIKSPNVANYVYNQLQLTGGMLLQGPPGTGKTYMIAELCARLCSEGKSVLVTAMTNRALMEVAGKDALKKMLDERRVLKTNITTDEYKENSRVVATKEIAALPATLVLSTFYIASGFAADLSVEQPFDYVIMDEASQALLGMFAASRKMGKKCLWVGDSKQLAPIVSLNGDRVRFCGYSNMIDGFCLMAESSHYPVYQLTTTYRFGQRAARYTGLFYEGTLTAKEEKDIPTPASLCKMLHRDGGPSLVTTDMDLGKSNPEFALTMTAYIVHKLLEADPTTEITVLTCMRNTTRALQRAIIQNVGAVKNVLVDTVARVQGLTTDVCIFFVPNVSYIRTLEPRLFNVATSRARQHTIIITDRDVLSYSTIKPTVRLYLEKLEKEQMVYVPTSRKKTENIGTTRLLDEML